MKPALCAGILCLLFVAASQAQESHWRGVPLAPENRCSEYDRDDDYPYPQSVELDIIEAQGGAICSPYTRECFENRTETDIEHIVSLSEAHDSGLCAADDEVKAQFAADPINLTLASPEVNREKSGKDAAEWLPKHNRCWFAAQILAVRLTYGLSIDPAEAAALEAVFSACEIPEESLPYLITGATAVNAYACAADTCAEVDRVNGYSAVMVIGELPDESAVDDTCRAEIVLAGAPAYLRCDVMGPVEPRAPWESEPPPPSGAPEPNPYEGLTCAAIYEEFSEANFGPDHPAYSARRDRDKDGIACER